MVYGVLYITLVFTGANAQLFILSSFSLMPLLLVFCSQYGEIDIDGSLVAAKTTGAEDIIMLNNGCLCCTVRGDLVRMISELVAKKKGKFDHIVIETTGKRLFICIHIFPVVRVCQIFDYFLFF